MTTAAPSRDITGVSPRPTRARLVVDDVHKRYGPVGNHVLALGGISLTVEPGEFVCLVGASGCGKSTLLNLIAGLDRPTAGTIESEGRIGLLFQESALFPWLTAAQNVNLALRLANVPADTRDEETANLLRLVHLQGFGDKRPHELSGGMRQRVALARALAQRADLLLMDEPFGSLDAITRDLLHDELERLWMELRFTTLFVTHDVREAVRLGGRVVILSSRPGSVVDEVPVDLPHPRVGVDDAMTEITSTITRRLRQEVQRHGR